MTDFIGNILEIGDRVAVIATPYRQLREGKVLRMNKLITVDIGSAFPRIASRGQVIKIGVNDMKNQELDPTDG